MTRKAQRQRKKQYKKRNSTLQKDTRQQRSIGKSLSTRGMKAVSDIVNLLKPYELSDNNKFKTYAMMIQDEAVWSSVESRITSIEVAQSNFKLKCDKNSERSVWLKDFINYNLANMQRTTRAIGRECAEMVYNGISLHELVASIKGTGEYAGMFTLDDLVYIDPLTIDTRQPYSTKDNGHTITYWRQNRGAFKDTNPTFTKSTNLNSLTGVQEIPASKVGVCAYSASSSRPMGTAALDAAYTPWREKHLINEFLLDGIQKDLAGMPVLGVPLDLLDKAGADPNSDEAATLNQLQEHLQNLHAGHETYAIVPTDTFNEAGSGAAMFQFKFQGVEGGGKGFDLVAVIEQKKKAIYNVLGASHLITGENGGGSYNLQEGKSNIAAHYSNRDNILIDEMYNKMVIPMILKLNGLTEELLSDIPVYKHGEVQPLSMDEKGKYFQRVQRALPITPVVANKLLEDLGIDEIIDENIDPEEFKQMLLLAGLENGAGESMGSSGVGETQAGGSSSDNNSENSA